MQSRLGLVESVPRRIKQLVLVAADAIALPVCLYLALSLRLEMVGLPPVLDMSLYVMATMLAIFSLFVFGVYRIVVRAFGEHFLRALVLAVSVYAAAFLVQISLGWWPGVPRSAPIVSACFFFLWVWGCRSLLRAVIMRGLGGRSPLLIYGAGKAGQQLAAVAASSREYRPVAFLDDSESLIGASVAGLPVFSGDRGAQVIARNEIRDVILALPSVSRQRRREIIDRLSLEGVHIRSLPRLDSIMSGRVSLRDLQEVDVADLLGRDPVSPHRDLFTKDIAGRVVMVTGAGGSIGSELCRQVLTASPARLVLFEQSEYALYAVLGELQARPDACELVAVLGSVQDESALLHIMQCHGVATVYHAAAYKHVPLVEANPFGGMVNNVLGTWHAARAAISAGVQTFVLISTDKAVRPTNVMGASKRLAELCLQALTRTGEGTRFCMVRFGNVLGSSGSVVPLFRRQIADGGPITLTHPDVTRYFMTIPEAAQLVIQAGAMGGGGDVFVLDMGEPVRIADLARQMIRLSGLSERTEKTPHGDIEIVCTGLRAGEKLYEELLIGDEHVQPTSHPRIRRAFEPELPLAEIEKILDEVRRLMDGLNVVGLKQLLTAYVEGYTPDFEASDVWSVPGSEHKASAG